MNPGRELDAFVAEKIFGHKIMKISPEEARSLLNEPSDPMGDVAAKMHLITALVNGVCITKDREIELPHYSTDIEAAWEIVLKMSNKDWFFKIDNINGFFGTWNAYFGRDPYTGYTAEAKTAPQAICLAALSTIKNFRL